MDDRSACEVFVSHEQLDNCCSLVTDEMTEEDTLAARQMASDVIAYLSGWTVFGTCSAIVRPQGVMCLDGRDAIPLTWPVRSIVSVWIDGVPLSLTQIAVVDKRYLIRTDCLSLPCHQNLGNPRTDNCTFEIEYTFGTDIPWQASLAAAELSCEYVEGCAGGACKLPATARGMNTQGMSLDLAGAEAVSAAGGGNLPMLTQFLAMVNPLGQSPTDVYSPDMPKLRRVEYPGLTS